MEYDVDTFKTTKSSSHEFIKISVTIKNSSSASFPQNPLDWKIKDGFGDVTSVPSEHFSASAINPLKSKELLAGEETTANLYFEVTKGFHNHNFILKYFPALNDEKSFDIDLGEYVEKSKQKN